MAQDEESVLLAKAVEAIRCYATVSTEELLRLASDQPYALMPVWSEGGVAHQRVFMGLEEGAAPRFSATTLFVNSVTIGTAIAPQAEAWCAAARPGVTPRAGTWISTDAINAQMREIEGVYRDIAVFAREGNASAGRRAEDWVSTYWKPSVVYAVLDPENGPSVWTSGLQAVGVHAARSLLRNDQLRNRFRECLTCGELLFSGLRAGPVQQACRGCEPSHKRRDQLKTLRNVLRRVGCPEIAETADEIVEHTPTVRDLRKAACNRAIWLLDIIHAAFDRAASRNSKRDQAYGMPISVDGVVRRLATPPTQKRGPIEPWAAEAFEELDLEWRSIPSKAEIMEAYRRRADQLHANPDRPETVPGRLRSALEDALVFIRFRQ